eukprot:scaffold10009_cov105-Cylindrotheca_fusiformis.AAC.3
MDLSQALRINNEGVGLLMQNRDREAIVLFINALNAMKQQTTNESELSSKIESQSDTPRSSPTNIHDATHTVPGLQDHSSFIYDDVLTFSLETINKNTHSANLAIQYASVVILNVALVYHCNGLRSNKNALDKAELLYDMVGRLLGNSDICQGTVLLVKAAAMNNLAQLRYHRGAYGFALEGFRHLGLLLARFGGNLRHTNCQETAYQGWLGFWMLISCVAPPILAVLHFEAFSLAEFCRRIFSLSSYYHDRAPKNAFVTLSRGVMLIRNEWHKFFVTVIVALEKKMLTHVEQGMRGETSKAIYSSQQYEVVRATI